MADRTGHFVADETGHKSRNRALWHGRLPMSVMGDSGLSAYAKLVYACIAAHAFQGNTAKIGQRRIAKLCCINRDTVASSIEKLLEQGHLKVFNQGRSRRMYTLLSPVFGQKQRSGVEEVVSSPSKTPRLASVRTA